MTKRNLELRMYFFVPYNISDIQKGIQAGHAALEYSIKYGNTKLFKDFVRNNKTWIILNGGTTRKETENKFDMGDMNTVEHLLKIYNIPFGSFREPDLNDALTAICFICDERAYDFEEYPDYDTEIFVTGMGESYKTWLDRIGGTKVATIRDLIKERKLA